MKTNHFVKSAVRAIGTWKIESLMKRLIGLATSADTPGVFAPPQLRPWSRGAEPKGAGSSRAWRKAVPRPMSRLAFGPLLVDSDPKTTAPRLAAWLTSLVPGQFDAAAIAIARVLERRGAPGLLASALDQKGANLSRRFGQVVRSSGP